MRYIIIKLYLFREEHNLNVHPSLLVATQCLSLLYKGNIMRHAVSFQLEQV